MSDYVEIMIIAEGHTEKRFIDEILTPYMAAKNIFIRGQLVGKAGHKGGNIRFSQSRERYCNAPEAAEGHLCLHIC